MKARFLSFLGLALLLAACQPGGTPAPGVASVTLEPASATVAVGASTTFSAVAKDADGNTLAGASFTWRSSAPEIASVANGVATGLKAGTTKITASAGGKTSAAATLTVTQAAGFTLELAPTRLPVLQGGSSTFTVTVERDADFSGAVTLSLSGLPQGSSANAVTIPVDASDATVTVSAAASAPHSLPTAVTLTGKSGDVTVTQTLTVTVRGPAGALDTSFAGGLNRTSLGSGEDYAEAVAVQSDGKIVVVGRAVVTGGSFDMAVVRYLRDGGLDTSFGSDGVVLVPFGSAGNEEAYAVAVQPDGKLLVAGSTKPDGALADMALVRLTADGALDTGFGSAGKVQASFGADDDRAYAVAVQADGKIIIAGDTYQGTATGVDFALARFNADGSLDTSFGVGGKVVQPVVDGSARDSIYDIALQVVGSETRIVAVGGEGDFVLARFTARGALDTSFGVSGRVLGVFGSTVGAARAVELDDAGNIVVAGHRSHDFALARFSASGALDASFGTGGTVITEVSTVNWDEAEALAVQADGKLVAGGWAYLGAGSKGDFALVRYNADGSLDASFGSDGKVVTTLTKASPFSGGKAVALQRDERVPVTRLLLAGADADTNHDFGLARYWP